MRGPLLLIVLDEPLDKAAQVAKFAHNFGSWSGLPIIAIGPKNGKIVGYGAFGKAIYAGSDQAKQLAATAAAKDHAPQTAIGAWLHDALGIPCHVSSTLVRVSEASGKMLEEHFGVPPSLKEDGHWVFMVSKLQPHVGKPFTPKTAAEHLHYAAEIAAGDNESDPFPQAKDLVEVTSSHPALQGSHGNRVFKSPDGRLWLFKGHDNPTTARAEEAACRLARLAMGDLVQPVKRVQLDGADGVLVGMVPGKALNDANHSNPPQALLQKHFDELVQHQVVDWITSNHDGHAGNYFSDGKHLYAIDKGQAWRFFGKDELSTSYKPNASAQVFVPFWQAFKDGKLKGDPVEAAKVVLDRLETVSEDQIRQIVAPYAATVAGWKGGDPQVLVDQIVSRVKGARAEWSVFLSQVTGKKVQLPVPGKNNFDTMPETAPVPGAALPSAAPAAPNPVAPLVVSKPGSHPHAVATKLSQVKGENHVAFEQEKGNPGDGVQHVQGIGQVRVVEAQVLKPGHVVMRNTGVVYVVTKVEPVSAAFLNLHMVGADGKPWVQKLKKTGKQPLPDTVILSPAQVSALHAAGAPMPELPVHVQPAPAVPTAKLEAPPPATVAVPDAPKVLEAAPPAPVPEAKAASGWPQTKGNVTVHHPGTPPEPHVKWPAKYPGPGFTAAVKYKGKDWTVSFALSASGDMQVSLTDPSKTTHVFSSPNQAADAMVLWEKGLSLNLSATEKKKLGISYPATKAFGVQAFAAELASAGAGPVEAAQVQEPPKSLYDTAAAVPDGTLVTGKDCIPHEVAEFSQAHFQASVGPKYEGVPPGQVLKFTGVTGNPVFMTAKVNAEGEAAHFFSYWKNVEKKFTPLVPVDEDTVHKVLKVFQHPQVTAALMAAKKAAAPGPVVGSPPAAELAPTEAPKAKLEVPADAPKHHAGPLAPGSTITVKKKGLGDVLLAVGHDVFVVVFQKDGKNHTQSFQTLSAASDWVWVNQQGFASADAWKQANGKSKVPSGGGWKFWGVKPAAEPAPVTAASVPEVQTPPGEDNFETMPDVDPPPGMPAGVTPVEASSQEDMQAAMDKAPVGTELWWAGADGLSSPAAPLVKQKKGAWKKKDGFVTTSDFASHLWDHEPHFKTASTKLDPSAYEVPPEFPEDEEPTWAPWDLGQPDAIAVLQKHPPGTLLKQEDGTVYEKSKLSGMEPWVVVAAEAQGFKGTKLSSAAVYHTMLGDDQPVQVSTTFVEGAQPPATQGGGYTDMKPIPAASPEDLKGALYMAPTGTKVSWETHGSGVAEFEKKPSGLWESPQYPDISATTSEALADATYAFDPKWSMPFTTFGKPVEPTAAPTPSLPEGMPVGAKPVQSATAAGLKSALESAPVGTEVWWTVGGKEKAAPLPYVKQENGDWKKAAGQYSGGSVQGSASLAYALFDGYPHLKYPDNFETMPAAEPLPAGVPAGAKPLPADFDAFVSALNDAAVGSTLHWLAHDGSASSAYLKKTTKGWANTVGTVVDAGTVASLHGQKTYLAGSAAPAAPATPAGPAWQPWSWKDSPDLNAVLHSLSVGTMLKQSNGVTYEKIGPALWTVVAEKPGSGFLGAKLAPALLASTMKMAGLTTDIALPPEEKDPQAAVHPQTLSGASMGVDEIAAVLDKLPVGTKLQGQKVSGEDENTYVQKLPSGNWQANGGTKQWTAWNAASLIQKGASLPQPTMAKVILPEASVAEPSAAVAVKPASTKGVNPHSLDLAAMPLGSVVSWMAGLNPRTLTKKGSGWKLDLGGGVTEWMSEGAAAKLLKEKNGTVDLSVPETATADHVVKMGFETGTMLRWTYPSQSGSMTAVKTADGWDVTTTSGYSMSYSAVLDFLSPVSTITVSIQKPEAQEAAKAVPAVDANWETMPSSQFQPGPAPVGTKLKWTTGGGVEGKEFTWEATKDAEGMWTVQKGGSPSALGAWNAVQLKGLTTAAQTLQVQTGGAAAQASGWETMLPTQFQPGPAPVGTKLKWGSGPSGWEATKLADGTWQPKKPPYKGLPEGDDDWGAWTGLELTNLLGIATPPLQVQTGSGTVPPAVKVVSLPDVQDMTPQEKGEQVTVNVPLHEALKAHPLAKQHGKSFKVQTAKKPGFVNIILNHKPQEEAAAALASLAKEYGFTDTLLQTGKHPKTNGWGAFMTVPDFILQQEVTVSTTKLEATALAKPKPPKPVKATKQAPAVSSEALDQAKQIAAWAKENQPVTDKLALMALAELQAVMSSTGEVWARQVGKDVLLGAPVGSYAHDSFQKDLKAHETVDTPLGKFWKVPIADLAALVNVGIIEGPDGQQYPLGTTFQTETVATAVKDLLPAEPGFTKTSPHNSDPNAVMLKFAGSGDTQKQQALAVVEKYDLELLAHPHSGAKGPFLGGHYTMLAVLKGELEKNGKTETKVTPKVPKQPEAFVPKGLPSFGSGKVGETVDAGPEVLSTLQATKLPAFGIPVLMGKPGVLRDFQVRVRRVRDKSGQEHFEVTGQLASFNADKSKLGPGTFQCLSASTAKAKQTSGYTLNYDEGSGVAVESGVNEGSVYSGSGYKGTTAGGSTVAVHGGGNPTFSDTFQVRIPADKDVHQELAAAFEAMGYDPADALAPLAGDSERVFKKFSLWRGVLGPDAWKKTLAAPKQVHSEKWLDGELAKLGSQHGFDPAAVLAEAEIRQTFQGHASVVAQDGKRFEDAGWGYAVRADKDLGSLFFQLSQGLGWAARKDKYLAGSGVSGWSAGEDVDSGGATGNFFRVAAHSNPVSGSYRVIAHPRVFERLDWRRYGSDCYGKIGGSKHSYDPVQRYQTSVDLGSGNEILFPGGVALQDIAAVTVSDSADKKKLKDMLTKEGVTEINGRSLDEFILVAPSHSDIVKAVKAGST